MKEEKNIIHCKSCGVDFMPKVRWQLYCSDKCHTSFNNNLKKVSLDDEKRTRFCKRCGTKFLYGDGQMAKQHCSDKCSSDSARLSRTKYSKVPINIEKKRTNERKRKIGNIERVYNRYPELPKSCQSCGESRVLDIAHKPEFRRNGAWRSASNCTPEKIWILCPTCHALLDRKHYAPESLGLC